MTEVFDASWLSQSNCISDEGIGDWKLNLSSWGRGGEPQDTTYKIHRCDQRVLNFT